MNRLTFLLAPSAVAGELASPVAHLRLARPWQWRAAMEPRVAAACMVMEFEGAYRVLVAREGNPPQLFECHDEATALRFAALFSRADRAPAPRAHASRQGAALALRRRVAAAAARVMSLLRAPQRRGGRRLRFPAAA